MNRMPIEEILAGHDDKALYNGRVLREVAEYALLLEKALELACQYTADPQTVLKMCLDRAKEVAHD